MTGVMSTPMPSPSMNGMIGLSGTGSPGDDLGAVRRDGDVGGGGRHRRAPSSLVARRCARQPTTRLVDARCSTLSAWRGRPAGGRDRAADRRHHDRGLRPPLPRVPGDERLRRSSCSRPPSGRTLQRAVQRADPLLRRARARVRRAADTELDAGSLDDATWRQAKLLYIGLLVDHKRPELAETFFNSVVTRVLRRTYVHNELRLRARRDLDGVHRVGSAELPELLPAATSLRETLVDVFRDFGWALRSPTSSATSTSSCRRCSTTSAGSGRRASPTSSCRCSAPPSTATRRRT